ncbi:PH domain-containing protein [Aestuariivivens sediminicola]|uniref:PH domain-containing protein n=1 Tax=Aestuariivivens sediminicola TaxID=2913560 RepID=UPI001F59C641|nr:PH domain-containing protein [Aestuariivivens sediminicola]
MSSQNTIIKEAQFSPKIKTYILLAVAFFCTISLIGIPFLIVWLLGLGQYVGRRYYENINCRLTNKHLEFKKGVFFKVEKTIPLENIQDITFIENPFLNYLDLRILKIETAGHSNPGGSDMKLIGIMDTQGFKQAVLDQREVLLSNSKPDNKGYQGVEKTNLLLENIRDLLEIIKDKS